MEIRYDDDALRLRVSDPAPGRLPAGTSGRGLAGIRDRAEALGGVAGAGPDPRGGWSVRCTIPVPR